MKAIKMLMIAALTVFTLTVFAQENNREKAAMKKEKKAKAEKKTYVCPMHPDVTTEKPGKCPGCKMSLREKEKVAYSCPMKCEGEKTYEKAGACPKCGMNLKEIEKHEIAYSCPMKCEGEKTYEKAGTCPKCGMNLKKGEKQEMAYACPMKCQGEKTYDRAGTCPQCGMKLKEKKSDQDGHKP